jgi:GNAT superfamily N-acetyltransferase
MSVEIVKVTTKGQLRKFVTFPIDKLYKNNPYYVPSLVLDEMGTIDTSKNPAFDFCERDLFLAYKDGKIAGRIAAIVNNRANEIWNQKYARFGFVDFIDDNEVVDALFEAAENWARAKGMEYVVGPMGFTDLDHEGLLIEGYDRISTMSTTYSYPYYKEQIERIGYQKEIDWMEFRIPVPDKVPERHQRIAKLVADKYGLKLLKFENLRQITPYVDKLFNQLNVAYAPLFGFTPLTKRQIDYYVKMYVPMLRWDLVSIIIKIDTDEVVGFGIGIPSLSYALQKSKGRLFPFGWFHLLKGLKGKGNKVVELLLMGVAPEYQGKGVNALIFSDFIPSAHNAGFRFAESNPELEINNKIQAQWDGFSAENHKKRRAYKKKI